MQHHKRLQQIESHITTPPKQPDPPPIVRESPRPYRAPRRVQPPTVFTVYLVVWSLLFSFGGIGSCFVLSVFSGAIGTFLGWDTEIFFYAFLGSIFVVPAVGMGLASLMWWAFESWTDYKVRIVAEGTARANNN